MKPALRRIDVIQEVARLADVPAESLCDDTPLADVVPDSFILVELALELEALSGVALEPDVLRRIRTVGDVVQAVVRDDSAPPAERAWP